MVPMLLRSELTGRVYIVTRYKRNGAGLIVSGLKYDVTEEFEAIAKQARESVNGEGS